MSFFLLIAACVVVTGLFVASILVFTRTFVFVLRKLSAVFDLICQYYASNAARLVEAVITKTAELKQETSASVESQESEAQAEDFKLAPSFPETQSWDDYDIPTFIRQGKILAI